MPAPTARTTIIVPTADAIDRLPYLIESLERTIDGPVELLILRHYRPDAPPDADAAFDRCISAILDRSRAYYRVPYREPFNYARMMNRAVSSVRRQTEYVCFVNDDILFGSRGWLRRMERCCDTRSDVAIVGCRLLYPDDPEVSLAELCAHPERHRGPIQHAGAAIVQEKGAMHVYRGRPADYPAAMVDRDVEAVTFALALVRRSLTDEMRFDELLWYDYNDMDLCLRAGERGHAVRYCASSVHVHLETVTRRRYDEHNSPHNKRHFMAKWRGRIATSPSVREVE